MSRGMPPLTFRRFAGGCPFSSRDGEEDVEVTRSSFMAGGLEVLDRAEDNGVVEEEGAAERVGE